MGGVDLYLGEPAEFWLELRRQADVGDTLALIREVASLRARCSFYESRIAQMDQFRRTVEETE